MATSPVAQWVALLMADLAVAFDTAEVLEGERSGVSHDMDRIAVFDTGLEEMAGRVVVGQTRVHVRYWPARSRLPGDETPADPTVLTQAAHDLAAFLQAKQASYAATGVWFSRMLSCVTDRDPAEWGVEAIVLLQFDNPAVIA